MAIRNILIDMIWLVKRAGLSWCSLDSVDYVTLMVKTTLDNFVRLARSVQVKAHLI